MSTQSMTLIQIRNAGLAALMNALGPVGMIRFLQQFETGKGDYSTERYEWLKEDNVDVLIKEIKKKRKSPK